MMEHYNQAPLKWCEELIGYMVDAIGPKCESPIELGLLRALVTLRLGDRRIRFADWVGGELLTDYDAVCHLQQTVGAHRVDFAFEVTRPGGPTAWLAVECDGHDFHERTKEQAARDKARDRAITTKGYRIMRFTGSEIYRDNMKCALEIYAAITALAEEIFA